MHLSNETSCLSSFIPGSFCFGKGKKNVKTNLRGRSVKMPSSPPVTPLPRNALGQFPSPKQPSGNKPVAFRGCLLPARLLLPWLTGPHSVRLPLLPWRAASGGSRARKKSFGLSLDPLKKRLSERGGGGREGERGRKERQKGQQQRRDGGRKKR